MVYPKICRSKPLQWAMTRLSGTPLRFLRKYLQGTSVKHRSLLIIVQSMEHCIFEPLRCISGAHKLFASTIAPYLSSFINVITSDTLSSTPAILSRAIIFHFIECTVPFQSQHCSSYLLLLKPSTFVCYLQHVARHCREHIRSWRIEKTL